MEKISLENFPFLNLSILKTRLSWSITLRWLIIAGYFFATLVAKHFFGLIFPYEKIWIVLAVLALINGLYLVILKLFKRISFQSEIRFLQIQIFVDLIFLTLLIHFAGGVENPIYLFYAFHVVLSSILFPGWRPIFFTTLIVSLFSTLVYLEFAGILFHYCIFHSNLHANLYFILIVLGVFTITVYITMYICMSFMFIYRNIKRQMDHQNQQLIQADHAKTKFFRFTSHELKSPVVAIKSSLESILKNYSGQLDARVEDLLRRSSARATQMLQIIRELLELSRNRVQLTEKKKALTDINILIKEIIEEERIKAEEKSIQIIENLYPSPLMLMIDQMDFKEIFINLLINAISYTPAGGTITIVSQKKDGKIGFSVEDTGIGIAETELEKVYDEFYRSENAKQAIQFGTGLGLSLVKQIVENYNGSIQVTSQLDKGTRFSIDLPVT